MRKPTFCICENEGAYQLRSNCEADQRLCFCYMDSIIPLLSKCACTARFVSNQKPHCWFSHDMAHIHALGISPGAILQYTCMYMYIENFGSTCIKSIFGQTFLSEILR